MTSGRKKSSTYSSPLRERLRVLTMIESGARAGELRGITLGDFDLFRKTLRVTGKGGKSRLIPISGELVNTVDEYMLTEYPLLERVPVQADFLWYGFYRMGDRVIGVKPERGFFLPRLLRVVEAGGGCSRR